MDKIIKCWTDAAYSPQSKVGSFGYKIGSGNIQTYITTLKNTQAELEAIEQCINECNLVYTDHDVIIYTDCQSAINKIYQPNIKIVKVKGHSKKINKSEIDMIFFSVDKAVRKTLRNYIKSNK